MSFIGKIKKGDTIYLAEVENKRINGTCGQHPIRYMGKEADGKTLLSASRSEVSLDSVKLGGRLRVLDFLAEERGLSRLLGPYGDEILSLVYAPCLAYKSLNEMPRWFERTHLNMILNLDGLTDKRWLNALDSLEKYDQEVLPSNIFQAVHKKYKLKVSGVIYAVTHT